MKWAARLLVLALALWGCATRRPDPLAMMHPYVWVADREVRFLACRWPDAARIPVALPEDASDEELQALRAALGAWEGAGLGVRFSAAGAQRAAIRLILVDGALERDDGSAGSGRATVDCLLPPSGPAALVGARVELARRTSQDWRGHTGAMAPAELAGTALHELGHALGFQGHARDGDDPLVRAPDVLRRLGRRILRGEPVHSRALAALYGSAAGRVLRVTPVSRWRTAAIDRLSFLGGHPGWTGPILRVGDTSARVFWRSDRGLEVAFFVPNLAETMTHPDRVLLTPNAHARGLLAEPADLSR